jgi:electron transfer flavoprotein alpha subunit
MNVRINPHLVLGEIAASSGKRRLNRLAPSKGAASASSRINPHSEYRARLRRELRQFDVAFTHPMATAPKKVMHRAADDAPLAFVVGLGVEPWSGAEAELLATTRELLPLSTVTFVSLGKFNCSPSEDGADRLIVMPDDFEDNNLAALMALVGQHQPQNVIFADAGISADLMRRYVAKTKQDAAFNVVQLRNGQVTCLMHGGKREFSRSAPPVIGLSRIACAKGEGDVLYEAKQIAPPEFTSGPLAFVDAGVQSSSAKDLPLSEAELVISAGAGLSDWKAFHDVADGLSAAVAGSRVVCDAGFLPRSRQVGASGQIIESRCYIAFGISGAPQHLQGIQACRHVIAINTDPHAPMMKRADLAIVANAQEVLHEMQIFMKNGGAE